MTCSTIQRNFLLSSVKGSRHSCLWPLPPDICTVFSSLLLDVSRKYWIDSNEQNTTEMIAGPFWRTMAYVLDTHICSFLNYSLWEKSADTWKQQWRSMDGKRLRPITWVSWKVFSPPTTSTTSQAFTWDCSQSQQLNCNLMRKPDIHLPS